LYQAGTVCEFHCFTVTKQDRAQNAPIPPRSGLHVRSYPQCHVRRVYYLVRVSAAHGPMLELSPSADLNPIDHANALKLLGPK
ncbi:hypothetical protein PILCRDRAFT_830362, partial [Piloderma croceum F 1598]